MKGKHKTEIPGQQNYARRYKYSVSASYIKHRCIKYEDQTGIKETKPKYNILIEINTNYKAAKSLKEMEKGVKYKQ